jgi:hypothetical protein
MLPAYRNPDDPAPEVSARRRGVKQGGMLFLLGVLIVPLLALFADFANSRFLEFLAASSAIICFVGGVLRMLYAAVFEEGAASKMQPTRPYIPAPMPSRQFTPPIQHQALPPPPVQPPIGWRRPNTAEIANPPSVTENTTRLLDKDERPE